MASATPRSSGLINFRLDVLLKTNLLHIKNHLKLKVNPGPRERRRLSGSSAGGRCRTYYNQTLRITRSIPRWVSESCAPCHTALSAAALVRRNKKKFKKQPGASTPTGQSGLANASGTRQQPGLSRTTSARPKHRNAVRLFVAFACSETYKL